MTRRHPSEADTEVVAESGGKTVPSPHNLEIARVIRDHHASVYRYAYRLTGSQADAEDLTQQTFLTVHQRLDQLREPDKIVAWLFAIVRSLFLKERRKKSPIDAASLELDVHAVPAAVEAETPIDRQALQQAINELPDEYKLVLMLFYFEDCSYKEIAEKLEIKIGTVMSRLARAKERLRWRLAKLAGEYAGSEPADK